MENGSADEVMQVGADTIDGYLALNLTYMLSLAKAGVRPVSPVPTSAEVMGKDSTEYVQVPLDVVMKYWWRCHHTAEQLPASIALSVLWSQDIAERTEWMDRFRHFSLTMGAVIRQTFEARSAHWDITNLLQTAKRKIPPSLLTDMEETGLSEGDCADSLRDGTKLCAKYNTRAGCKNKNCKLDHRCGYVGKTGRVCGSWGHNFIEHNRK